MKLSVIIPCYNFENYIEQSVMSALFQKTNFDFEILVGDDKSSDRSVENILRLGNYIRIIKSEVNLGPSRNIKNLIEQSKGEYIAYLDGDDYWTDMYKLQKQIEYMELNKDCVMTFCGYWQKDATKYIPESTHNWLCIPGGYENDELPTERLVFSNTATFGRVFRNIPGLIKDWMLDLIFFDWVTNYELSKFGKIKYLDFPCGVYRAHGKGTMTSLSHEDALKEAKKISEIIKIEYENWSINKLDNQI